MLSTKEWDKRHFARQAGLLIYEASNDVFKLLGKEFREMISNTRENCGYRMEVLNYKKRRITATLSRFYS